MANPLDTFIRNSVASPPTVTDPVAASFAALRVNPVSRAAQQTSTTELTAAAARLAAVTVSTPAPAVASAALQSTVTLPEVRTVAGPQGPRGDPGPAGADGLPGAAGETATFSVGTVTTGGTSAVTVTGSPPNYILNFELEAGPAGPGGGDVSTLSLYADPEWITSLSASKVGLGNVTNESKATMFTNPTFTGTVSGVTATHVGLGNVTNESKATMFTAPTFTGTTTLQQSTEVLNTKTGATGTVVHDFSTGSIWYHSSISANFTANFTNVPTTEDRTISIALILSQGGTAYIPNAVEINGSAASIKWSEGSAPSGTINYTDIVNFILIRTGGSWTVLGSLSTYN